MKLITFLLRSAPGVVTLAVVAGLFAGVSNTALLVIINNALASPGAAGGGMVWAFVAVCLLMLVGRSASSVLLIRLSRWSIYELRLKLSRQILAAPLRHTETLGAGRLLATLTEDVGAIANGLTNVPLLCVHLVVVVTCLAYLCWLSWAVFLGTLGFMAVGVLSYQLVLSRGQRHMHLSRHEWDALLENLRSLTDGAKELKLNARRREAFLEEQLGRVTAALRLHGYLGDRNYALAAGWGQLLVFVLLGLLLFGLPALAAVESRTLVGYTLVILYIMSPLEAIMNLLPAMGRTDVALKKVSELGLSLERSSTEAQPAAAIPPASFERVELAGVTHAYYREGEENHFQLGPISLAFEPGGVYFLIGGNGSGKTTLAKLITGLYSPEGGEVRLDGRAVDDGNREEFRQLFSAVFSDFHLFERLLGLDGPGLDARARAYLAELRLEHKLQVRDGALSTSKLSQGQRKRLALLTAYLEDRPFYVFDEWAADQDPSFKEVFYLRMLPELKARGKAVLVISHDDHYYHVADYLIKLDYGQIESCERVSRPRARAGAVT
jgi:putative pyoverdin transport system ATP-binding/permease protein